MQKTLKSLKVCKVDAPKKGKGKGKGGKKGKGKGKMPDSWYCSVCQEVEIRDMRQCVECCTWVHEACVGLLPEDTAVFFCPACDTSD